VNLWFILGFIKAYFDLREEEAEALFGAELLGDGEADVDEPPTLEGHEYTTITE
jgi:hypothetical protein